MSDASKAQKPTPSADTFRYDVAISFAGEDREIAERIAIQLRSKRVKVFYDEFERAALWGKNLYDYLTEVYAKESRYCLILVSESYNAKAWTRIERQSLQSRALSTTTECILPVRLDDSEVVGLLGTIAYEDLRKTSIENLVTLICQKLGRKPSFSLAGLFQRRPLRVELRGDKGASIDVPELHRINDLLVSFNRESTCIVGCDRWPYRVQLETDTDVLAQLQKAFLTGELDTLTGVKWTGISSFKEKAWLAPTQTPIVFFGDYAEAISGKSIVCHLSYIDGFSREEDEAKKILGEDTTSEYEKIRIYITRSGGFLYAHSNFLKEGCEYPTKIATEAQVSLFTILKNIVFGRRPTSRQLERLRAAHAISIRYVVNERGFSKGDAGFFCGALNVEFVSV